MRNKLIMAATLMVALLMAGSCKPTENNYRAAYDAAQGKRQTVDTDADILNSGRIDEHPDRSSATDEFRVETRRFDPPAGVGEYMFVVARYSMSTNAEGHAAALREKGYEAKALRLGDDEWYVAASSFADPQSAQDFGRKFVGPERSGSWIGLPAPFILRANRH